MPNEDVKNTIVLGDEDAAVVIRGNGSVDMIIPKQGRDEPAAYASLCAVRCVSVLKNPMLLAIVDVTIDKTLEELIDKIATPQQGGYDA